MDSASTQRKFWYPQDGGPHFETIVPLSTIPPLTVQRVPGNKTFGKSVVIDQSLLDRPEESVCPRSTFDPTLYTSERILPFFRLFKL